MLLSEQVRQLADEESLIDDSTTYTRDNAAWGTVKDYGNITLSSDSLIIFRFQTSLACSLRLKIGSYYVFGINAPGGIQTYTGIAYFSAGTYAVIVEGRNGAGTQNVYNFKLGRAKFSDEVYQTLITYTSQISKTVANRTCVLGALNQAVFAVNCWAYTPGAQTNFENVGDSLTNGVSLSVDGVQVDWTTRNQDSGSKENAYANYHCPLSVGSSHTFAITKDNANTVVHISIVATPWLLASVANEPVTLDFPQGSTIYLILEPLDADPTKNVKLGKKRCVSFGDSTDYYSTGSGTGILSWNYTFETVKVGDVTLTVNGLGGCVSIIACDIR